MSRSTERSYPKEDGQTPRSGHMVKNRRCPGLDTRITRVKYQSSSIQCSKVISQVKAFKKYIRLQGQCHRVKMLIAHRKVLSM